ncbi:MAG: hypothetical protein Q9170_006844 [Blastenia crenularia]
MRLLDTKTIDLHEFHGESVPDYAILSHTWEAEEVSYQLLGKPEATSLAGYSKITKCCEVAAAQGWKYLWVDTCCIDKSSSAELSEAINSMWRWYQNSGVCLAYLADCVNNESFVSRSTKFSEIIRWSRWFTRGWTLQELLAPTKVVFYDASWNFIGDKVMVSDDICNATGITRLHLQHPKQASIAAKMSWMSKRKTTRPEDVAYSLLGLFDVYMPLIYGEGSNAFIRLQQEIVKNSNDESIFAWTDDNLIESGMFALSPAAFADSGNVITFQHSGIRKTPYSVTNFGMAIEVDPGVFDHVINTPNDLGFSTYQSNKPYPWKMPIACTRGFERQPLALNFLSVAGNTVRVDVGRLMTYKGPIVPRNEHRVIYVKSFYRHRASEWREPNLELRWNKTFEEYLTYVGSPHGGAVSERMNQNGMVYSNYAGKTVARRFIRSVETALQDRRGQAEEMVPEVVLQWRLEPGGKTISGTIFVSRKDKSRVPSLQDIAYDSQAYDLGLGGEITVPLWNDLHLRAELSKETFGEGTYFIDLKLIVSKRRKIFYTLK